MINRRDFLRLAALGGGAVFMSGLSQRTLAASGKAAVADDFYFVQLSDSHWGYSGPDNPDAAHTLEKAVAAVNALEVQPDFIMFTGDLTHTTDDPAERRQRMAEFRDIIKPLKVKNVHLMPGEHDAGLDGGAAFHEAFGPSNYVFDHKGVHFIVVDNVSAPGSTIGPAGLAWLQDELAKLGKDDPVVVFTHRPLFDLVPKWDWATRDGDKAIAMLMPFNKVTVFYGHIHQENHHMTGHIAHHSAKSLIFPLPAPGSQDKRTPLSWDPAHPYQGLGFREVDAEPKSAEYKLTEFPVLRGRA